MTTMLITGGTGKFGRVLIDFFLKKSINVIFTSTSDESISTLLRQYELPRTQLEGIRAILTDPDGTQKLMAALGRRSAGIHHLVNNARNQASLAIEENGLTSRRHFMDEFLLDVVVPYELSMALACQGGSQLRTVTNIGSQYGLVAPNPSLYTNFAQQSAIQYGVAKAALTQLTRELAVRLADRNVRVNCVAYGGVRGRVDAAFQQRYASLAPNRRMLDEQEIPGPIDFLISDASSAMTGQTISADGGWTIW